jgi:hypothetical protein
MRISVTAGAMKNVREWRSNHSPHDSEAGVVKSAMAPTVHDPAFPRKLCVALRD